MAKREVNAISKGRAAKGKRETSARKTYTTGTGAQQYHNKDTLLETITRLSRSKDPEIRSRDMEIYYAAMGKDYPDSSINYAAAEREAAERSKTFRQKLSDIDEARNKVRMNLRHQSVDKYAAGGKVIRGDGACMKGHTKGRMV